MNLCELKFFSSALGKRVAVNVLLPEGPASYEWECAWSADEPLPVLYLLGGNTDDHTQWLRKTSLERYAEGMKLAIVMPPAERCVYCDQKNGYRYFEFISKEVPEVVRQYFNISAKREDTFIAGFSMGGYGTIKTALKYPERYCFAASISGLMDFKRFPVLEDYFRTENREDMEKLKEEKGIGAYEVVLDHVTALGYHWEIKGSDNDLCHLVKTLKSQKKVCPELKFFIGKDDFLKNANDYFTAKLTEAEIPYRYEISDGDHNWDFADKIIRRVLKALPIK